MNGSQQLGEEEQLSGQGVHIDEKNNNVDHLGFYLQRAYTKHHKVPYGDFNYSTLETVFLLQRKYSAYLMQVSQNKRTETPYGVKQKNIEATKKLTSSYGNKIYSIQEHLVEVVMHSGSHSVDSGFISLRELISPTTIPKRTIPKNKDINIALKCN